MEKMTLPCGRRQSRNVKNSRPVEVVFLFSVLFLAHERVSVKKGSGTMPDMVPYGQNFAIVIPMERRSSPATIVES